MPNRTSRDAGRRADGGRRGAGRAAARKQAGTRGQSNATRGTSGRGATGGDKAARDKAGQAPGKASGPDKATFRRRRLVVALVALLIVAGLAFGGTMGVRALIDRFGPGGPTAEPDSTGETTTSTASTEEETPDEEALANPVGCLPQAIELASSLDSTQPAAGSQVSAAVTITNRGQVPCLLDVGHTALQMTVTSGEDQVWTSAQCPAGSAEIPVLLDIGAQEQRTLTWSGHRSAEGCPGDTAAAEPGTYVIEVALDVAASRVAQEQALTLR